MIFVKKYPFYYYEVRFGFGSGSVLLVRVRVRFGRTKKSWFGRSLLKVLAKIQIERRKEKVLQEPKVPTCFLPLD